MINTPFGSMHVCDAHTHFFSTSFYAGLGKQLGLGDAAAGEVVSRLGWEACPEDPAEVGLRWVGEMNRHGIERMVSIHTLPGDLTSAGRGIAAAQGRLVGYTMVNPLADGAPAAVERAATEFGFRGVALFPAMFRFSMTSDAAYAVLQAADKHRLNVFVHCGVLKVGFRNKLGLPSAFDGSLASPLALQRPCAEFPRLRFVVPHLGSGMFRELLMLADQAPNVYSDTSGIGGWAKYLDGAPARHQVLRQAVDVMGADRLLFGTDSTFFPRGWRVDMFEQQMQAFREAKLTDEQAAKILAGNLDRLLG